MSLNQEIVLGICKGEIKLQKIKVTETYPQKDNCLEVEVYDGDGELMYTNPYFPKAEFELIEYLHSLYIILKSNYKLGNPILRITFSELCDKIEDFGNEKYTQASDNAAMEEAGEDI